jgi:hypothetical protein
VGAAAEVAAARVLVLVPAQAQAQAMAMAMAQVTVTVRDPPASAPGMAQARYPRNLPTCCRGCSR